MSNEMKMAKWNKPESIPQVAVGEVKEFWVAVEVIQEYLPNKPIKQIVFCAQYVNKPVSIDEDGEPDHDDYFVDEDGDPISCVGWYGVKRHADFDDYYEDLPFSDTYKLLGWSEYIKPIFSLEQSK